LARPSTIALRDATPPGPRPLRALVTGGSGFVGHHLVALLQAEGDEVITCDRSPIPGGEVLDITDADATTALVRKVAPEVIYHLAGWADVGGSWRAPVEAFRANAEGTLNVLQAATDVGVDRVLAVSSADVYGAVSEAELPLTEDSPLRPASPYAASKVAADYLGLQAFLGRKLPVLRVRAFNHLGPGQTDKFVAPALASRIARNEIEGGDVITIGNLSARRDFTDVRDVVRAYRLLVEHGEPGEVYNVCSGRDVAVQELADQLLAMARRPMRFESDPELLRPVDVPVLRGDHSRLTAATGWQPEIPLSRTLTDLLDDWRQRLAAR
jgi:GDP-4-dehydro-6-deoxy-D-mannose reductase